MQNSLTKRGRGAKLILTFDPVTQNQLSSSCHDQQLAYEVWKWSDKNCSLYHGHMVNQAEYQRWPWSLSPGLKINRVPPLFVFNLHVKFESVWSKTVVKAKHDRHTHRHTHTPNNTRMAAIVYPLQCYCEGIIKHRRQLVIIFDRKYNTEWSGMEISSGLFVWDDQMYNWVLSLKSPVWRIVELGRVPPCKRINHLTALLSLEELNRKAADTSKINIPRGEIHDLGHFTESTPRVGRFIIPLAIATHQ